MPRDKAVSHQRIVEAAKSQFLKFGYEKASMRDIGKAAGLTQAALYRHYESKEDMFNSLVEPMIQSIKKDLRANSITTKENFSIKEKIDSVLTNNTIEVLKKHLPEYQDEFRLVICCSKGTQYENIVHRTVMSEQKSLMKVINYLKQNGYIVKEIDEQDLHLILTAYIDTIFETIVQDWPIEKIKNSLTVIEKFYIPGWKEILGY